MSKGTKILLYHNLRQFRLKEGGKNSMRKSKRIKATSDIRGQYMLSMIYRQAPNVA